MTNNPLSFGYSFRVTLLEHLFVEPDVFHAPAVEDAVDHDRQPLDMRLPAARAAVVKDDRPGAVFRQFALDLPYQLLALLGVGLDGLPIDQRVHLGTAVAVIVQLPTAPVIQVETEVRIDPAALAGEADDVVLAHDLGEPVGSVDRFELAVDVHLLQLVEQDYRRIPQERQVAHRDLYLEPVSGPVTELAHELAGFRAVFLNIGVIAGQRLQHLRRHTPQSFGRGLHGPADVALPFGDDVDERRTVQTERHRLSQIRVVEGRHVPVDDQAAADAERHQLADRLRHLALYVPEQRHLQAIEEGHIELAGDKCQSRGRLVADDRILDAIEIRPA